MICCRNQTQSQETCGYNAPYQPRGDAKRSPCDKENREQKTRANRVAGRDQKEQRRSFFHCNLCGIRHEGKAHRRHKNHQNAHMILGKFDHLMEPQNRPKHLLHTALRGKSFINKIPTFPVLVIQATQCNRIKSDDMWDGLTPKSSGVIFAPSNRLTLAVADEFHVLIQIAS